MKIKPFKNAGRFTTFENDIIDFIMPLCKPNTWKIVCATIRKTTGWHKEEDWISVSQFMKITGIVGRGTCHTAIIDAVESKFLIKTKYRNSFKYALNKQYEIRNVPKIGTDIVTESGTSNVPKIGHTKETTTKDKSTKEKKNTYTNDLKKQFVYVLADVMEMDATINFAKLARWGKVLHGGKYTPHQISKIYGYGGVYWKEDWRGKKGQLPNYSTITATIKSFTRAFKEKEGWKKYVEGEFGEFIEH